jgi:alpha-ribazole phosphatase
VSLVTRWWWLRHGPVADAAGRFIGRTDLPIDGSAMPAEHLKGLASSLPADAVWVASPARRARETHLAIAAAGAPGADPIIEPGFSEQDFGDWDGRRHDEIAGAAGTALERFWALPADAAPPSGESFAAVVARVGAGIDLLNEAYAGRDIVVIAHGGSIRAALARALGLSPAGALAFVIDTLRLTRIDHIGIAASLSGQPSPPTTLQVIGSAAAWRVLTVNCPASA